MAETVYVTYSGPLFDERFRNAVNDFMDAAVWEITKVGRGDLGVQFIRVFKEPTGYYESHVEAVRHGREGLIHDTERAKLYGPWLEGTGSRNFPVTRFRGYRSFRIVAHALQEKAVPIAETVLRKYLPRMGGNPA